MIDNPNKIPLIVIVGPTASGKTALAIEVAKKHNGEIICADSRSIYKSADIGTAKPTLSERRAITHYGLDLVYPDEYFTAANFKEYAENKIKEIKAKNKIPILVGGTGLYIDSIIFNYSFATTADLDKREKLNKLSLEELHSYCKESNIKLPENYKNKRYVIRAIEKNGVESLKIDYPRKDAIIVGIATDKDELMSRIRKRSEFFFKNDVINETIFLSEKYGWNNEAMKSNVYKLVKKYFEGGLSLDELNQQNIIADWHLVKKQMTWFKRNIYIKWLPINEIDKYISAKLAKIK